MVVMAIFSCRPLHSVLVDSPHGICHLQRADKKVHRKYIVLCNWGRASGSVAATDCGNHQMTHCLQGA